jgi:hypothetical protein
LHQPQVKSFIPDWSVPPIRREAKQARISAPFCGAFFARRSAPRLALAYQPGNLCSTIASVRKDHDGFGADLDSTTVTKLEGHAELVTELVNKLLQTYIIANDDNYGAQLAA